MNRRYEIERSLRRWLRAHHGAISEPEALDIGATVDLVRAKVHRGEWSRTYPLVYRDTAAPNTELQTLRCACLATGAVASHASAAWLWHLLDHPPPRPEVTVAASNQNGRRLPRLKVHRSTDIDWARTVTRNAIPVTDPLRTLVDLAAIAMPATLLTAVDQAVASRLVTIEGLLAEATRLARRGRPGPTALKAVIEGGEKVAAPKPSVLERKTMELIARYHLPRPTVEQHAGADGQYRLDFAYADIRFGFEVDGYQWHFSPEHLRRDHARRNELQRHGWVVLVYTWRDVIDRPARVAADIAAMHAERSAARASAASQS